MHVFYAFCLSLLRFVIFVEPLLLPTSIDFEHELLLIPARLGSFNELHDDKKLTRGSVSPEIVKIFYKISICS